MLEYSNTAAPKTIGKVVQRRFAFKGIAAKLLPSHLLSTVFSNRYVDPVHALPL
jgi:hypothetical protein